MLSDALARARACALNQGLCADIGPYQHLCTRYRDHPGRHQGPIHDGDSHSRVFASWSDTPDMMVRSRPGG